MAAGGGALKREKWLRQIRDSLDSASTSNFMPMGSQTSVMPGAEEINVDVTPRRPEPPRKPEPVVLDGERRVKLSK